MGAKGQVCLHLLGDLRSSLLANAIVRREYGSHKMSETGCSVHATQSSFSMLTGLIPEPRDSKTQRHSSPSCKVHSDDLEKKKCTREMAQSLKYF